MNSLSKELGFQGKFENSMKSFISDPEMAQSISGLSLELLQTEGTYIGATSKGFSPKDHAFNPYNLETHLDGVYAFGVFMPDSRGDEDPTPAVMYSFDVRRSITSALDVVQIQAVQSYPEGMPLKKWETFGLSLIEMFGEWRQDIGAVLVRPVSQNNWFNHHNEDSKWYRAGKMRYDVTASRSAYAYDAGLKRFIKPLPITV